MRALIIAAAMCVGVSANAAQVKRHTVEMPVGCMQNVNDGRILVDGTLMANNATYVIKSYKPLRRGTGIEADWTLGNCIITLTNANP